MIYALSQHDALSISKLVLWMGRRSAWLEPKTHAELLSGNKTEEKIYYRMQSSKICSFSWWYYNYNDLI